MSNLTNIILSLSDECWQLIWSIFFSSINYGLVLLRTIVVCLVVIGEFGQLYTSNPFWRSAAHADSSIYRLQRMELSLGTTKYSNQKGSLRNESVTVVRTSSPSSTEVLDTSYFIPGFNKRQHLMVVWKIKPVK